MIELFKSCYAMGTEGEIRLGSEALVFLKRWKNNRNHEESFETLSTQCEKLLKIEDDLEQRSAQDLIDLDYFRLIDNKILHELIQAVLAKTISSGKCKLLARSRRTSHWYREFEHIYEAVNHAAEFISLIDALNIKMDSLSAGG